MKGLEDLAGVLAEFAAERDWAKFHTPKNLASALVVEAGELLEVFQWLTDEESRRPTASQMQQIRREAADVLIYLVRLADILGVDLLEAAEEKVVLNHQKYPADLVRGRADLSHA
jgi:dCTP diphosphatase